MRPVPLGTKGTYTITVRQEHLANRFKDAILPPVLATPVMLLFMENAALKALKPYIEPGESVVGTGVQIQHLAASPVGAQITAEAEVVAIEGRRIAFNVSARDGYEEIGKGTHDRMVVDLNRLDKKLKAKGG